MSLTTTLIRGGRGYVRRQRLGLLGSVANNAVLTFGSLTGVGRGGIAVGLPDGDYGPITVSSGIATPNASLALDGDTDRTFGDLRLIVPGPAYHSVASMAEIGSVFGAMGLAEGGEIKLRDGVTGNSPLNLTGRRFTSEVRISSDTPLAATLPGVQLDGSSFIYFDRMDIERRWVDELPGPAVVELTNTDDITLFGCGVHSTPLADIPLQIGNTVETTLQSLAGIVTGGQSSVGNGSNRLKLLETYIGEVFQCIGVEGEDILISGCDMINFYTNGWQLKGLVPGATIIDNSLVGAWANDQDPGGAHSGLGGMANDVNQDSPGITVERNFHRVGSNRFDAKGDRHGRARGFGFDEAQTPGNYLSDIRVVGNVTMQNLPTVVFRRIASGVYAYNTILFDEATRGDPGIDYNVTFNMSELESDIDFYGNLGPTFATGDNIHPDVMAKQSSNIPIHFATPDAARYIFDDPDISTVTKDDFATRLIPAAGRAPMLGKIKSGACGHIIDHANKVSDLPPYTPPVTSTATGVLAPAVQFTGSTDFDVPYTGTGGGSVLSFNVTFDVTGVTDGQAFHITQSPNLLIQRLANSNWINFTCYDVSGIIANFNLAQVLVAADGLTTISGVIDMATGEATIRRNGREAAIRAVTAMKLGSTFDRVLTKQVIGSNDFGNHFPGVMHHFWLGSDRIELKTDAGLDIWEALDGLPPAFGAGGVVNGVVPDAFVEGDAAAWNSGAASQGPGGAMTRNGPEVTDVAGYVQRYVDNGNAGSFQAVSGQLVNGPQFSFAARVIPNSNSGTGYMFLGHFQEMRAIKSNQNLVLFFQDTANATLMNATTSGSGVVPFTAGQESLIEIHGDLRDVANGSIITFLNGVQVPSLSATGIASNGLWELSRHMWLLADNSGAGGKYQGEIAELWFHDGGGGNLDAIGPNGLFYNGGAAADWISLAGGVQPAIHFGGQLAADWSAGNNRGDATITVSNSTFTDV